MKIYISADIEGVAGMTSPDEANPDHPSYRYFQEQMTLEVNAACEGALAAGAREVWVKDAHWHGLNINARQLPREVKIVRGWSGHPYKMMDGLDRSFDAVCFVGYHARARSGGNPLAHTMSSRRIYEITLNGELASEFRINSYTAALEGVPVCFLSGDRTICEEGRTWLPTLYTVPTLEGYGEGTVSIHPELAVERIRSGVHEALRAPLDRYRLSLQTAWEMEIAFKITREAYGKSFYPGAERVADDRIRFRSTHYFDILRFLAFMLA